MNSRMAPMRWSCAGRTFLKMASASAGFLSHLSRPASTPGISPSVTWYLLASCAVTILRSDTRSRTSLGPSPKALAMSMAAAMISASAAGPGSPMMSMFSWKCSRSRPRCCRS